MRTGKTLGIVVAMAVCAILVSGCPPNPRMVYNQGDYGEGGRDSELGSFEICDDFTLEPNRSTITQVRWWGIYRDNLAVDDDFTLRLYYDAGDGPERDFASEHHAGPVNRQIAGNLDGVHDIYRYSCDIPLARLEAGTRYYLGILNNCTGDWLWMHNDSATQGDSDYYSGFGPTPWVSEGMEDMAFQLWTDRR